MFTQLPNNYSSLYSELQYQVQTTSTKDITIVVNDYNSSECIGVKKFYSTSDLLVNVAPIIRPFAIPAPNSSVTGFFDSNRQGYLTIELVASSDDTIIATSTPRTFTLSHKDESESTIVTTIPLQRLLSLGERDITTYIGNPNSIVSATTTLMQLNDDKYTELESQTTYHTTDNSGIAQFLLSLDSTTASNDEQIDKIVVEVKQSGETLATLEYFVTEPTHSATRLAWVSSRGFIEHYTFTEIKSRNETADATELTLLSAFETHQTRNAIAELMTSPQIWVATQEGYTEAEVVSSSIETAPFDAVATIEVGIKI